MDFGFVQYTAPMGMEVLLAKVAPMCLPPVNVTIVSVSLDLATKFLHTTHFAFKWLNTYEKNMVDNFAYNLKSKIYL